MNLRSSRPNQIRHAIFQELSISREERSGFLLPHYVKLALLFGDTKLGPTILSTIEVKGNDPPCPPLKCYSLMTTQSYAALMQEFLAENGHRGDGRSQRP